MTGNMTAVRLAVPVAMVLALAASPAATATPPAAAQPLMAAYTRSGDDLDLLIRDNAAPLHATLVHAAGMSASGDLMLADAQWKTHQLLHPDKVKLGFWGAAWAGVKAIHAIEPPIF